MRGLVVGAACGVNKGLPIPARGAAAASTTTEAGKLGYSGVYIRSAARTFLGAMNFQDVF